MSLQKFIVLIFFSGFVVTESQLLGHLNFANYISRFTSFVKYQRDFSVKSLMFAHSCGFLTLYYVCKNSSTFFIILLNIVISSKIYNILKNPEKLKCLKNFSRIWRVLICENLFFVLGVSTKQLFFDM